MLTFGHMTFDQPGSAPTKIDIDELVPSSGTGEGFFGMLDLSLDRGKVTVVPQTKHSPFPEKTQLFLRMHVSKWSGTGANSTREPVRLLVGQGLEVNAAAGQSPREIVAMVRKAFALNMSQLAKVLGVERPTAYAWASLDDPSKIREEARRQRLRSLLTITKQWVERGVLAPAATELPLADGGTLLALLSADNLDVEAIMQAHAQLSVQKEEIRAQGNAETRAFADAIVASLRGFGKPAADK